MLNYPSDNEFGGVLMGQSSAGSRSRFPPDPDFPGHIWKMPPQFPPGACSRNSIPGAHPVPISNLVYPFFEGLGGWTCDAASVQVEDHV